MRITAAPTEYTLSVQPAVGGGWTELKTIPVGCIVRNRPSDSRNVGTHFGLYSQSSGWPCMSPAYFRDATWSYTREGGV